MPTSKRPKQTSKRPALPMTAPGVCISPSINGPSCEGAELLYAGGGQRSPKDVLAEPDLREYVQEELGGVVERLTARFTAGKEAGDLPAEFDPSSAAPIIATYLHGLFRTAPVSYNRPQLERQRDVLLTGLGC